MQFLVSVLHDSDELATSEEMARIDEFNDRLQAQGQLVFACGLSAPGQAFTVDARGEAPSVETGPAIQTPEFVVGFWVLEAPDQQTALKLATEGSAACNRKVELRALL